VLGKALPTQHEFNIVTKTPQFKKSKLGADDARNLKDTFFQSLSYLGKDSLYGLMIHHADDLLVNGGEYLFEAMQELKTSGKVNKIGVSAYNGEQIDGINSRYAIDLIQVPVNLLDQRLIQSGHLNKMKKLGVEIHIRSVFLQGILLVAPEDLPAYFEPVQNHLKKFHADCALYGTTPLCACLDYAMSLPETDRVIVGICTKKELQEILSAIYSKEVFLNYSKYAWYDEMILNPAKWSV